MKIHFGVIEITRKIFLIVLHHVATCVAGEPKLKPYLQMLKNTCANFQLHPLSSFQVMSQSIPQK